MRKLPTQEEIRQAERRQLLREDARIAAETRKLAEETGDTFPPAPWEREFLAEETPERQAADEEILRNRWTVIDGSKVYVRAMEWAESLMRQYCVAKKEMPVLEALAAPDLDAWPLAPKLDVTGIRAKGGHSDPTGQRAAQLEEAQRLLQERQAKVMELRRLIAAVDMTLAVLEPVYRAIIVHSVIAKRSDPDYQDAAAIGQRFCHRSRGADTLRNLALLEAVSVMLPMREWNAES